MLVTEQEIIELKNFILQLNSARKSVVIVEGKKDVVALKKLGYLGRILEFQKFGGMVRFTDFVAKYENVILLFDRDKKGRWLTARTIQLLQRRTRIDLSYKRNLRIITRGKIKCIEQLSCYEDYFS